MILKLTMGTFQKPNLIIKGKEPSQKEPALNLSQKIHAFAFLYFLI